MYVQLLPGRYLPTILLLVHLLKSGKSDHCSANRANTVTEKQICDTRGSYNNFRAINVYSHGIPNGVTQCICQVDLPSSIKYLSVGYYINSGGKDDCGVKVNLGNSRSFSCRSQRHANVSRFNDIKFFRTTDSSPYMCLEIRSAAPVRIQCQPSPINYIVDNESKESEAEDLDVIPTTKSSTRQTVTFSLTRQPVTSSSSSKDSSVVQSSTSSTSTTRRPSSIKTSTNGREKDSDTAFSSSSTTAMSPVALTELPGETTSVSVNDTTDPLVVPVGEYKDTPILVGIFVPLMVILIVMTAFCIRYKYKKQRKGSRLIAQDSATFHQLDTTTDDKKTDDEATVTYNVAYNMEIPPDYPANNGSIHNTGEKCGNVYDKARDDDLVITYNVMYNVGLNNEATGDNSNRVLDYNAVGDTTYEIKENQAHIYHEINESMQEL